MDVSQNKYDNIFVFEVDKCISGIYVPSEYTVDQYNSGTTKSLSSNLVLIDGEYKVSVDNDVDISKTYIYYNFNNKISCQYSLDTEGVVNLYFNYNNYKYPLFRNSELNKTSYLHLNNDVKEGILAINGEHRATGEEIPGAYYLITNKSDDKPKFSIKKISKEDKDNYLFLQEATTDTDNLIDYVQDDQYLYLTEDDIVDADDFILNDNLDLAGGTVEQEDIQPPIDPVDVVDTEPTIDGQLNCFLTGVLSCTVSGTYGTDKYGTVTITSFTLKNQNGQDVIDPDDYSTYVGTTSTTKLSQNGSGYVSVKFNSPSDGLDIPFTINNNEVSLHFKKFNIDNQQVSYSRTSEKISDHNVKGSGVVKDSGKYTTYTDVARKLGVKNKHYGITVTTTIQVYINGQIFGTIPDSFQFVTFESSATRKEKIDRLFRIHNIYDYAIWDYVSYVTGKLPQCNTTKERDGLAGFDIYSCFFGRSVDGKTYAFAPNSENQKGYTVRYFGTDGKVDTSVVIGVDVLKYIDKNYYDDSAEKTQEIKRLDIVKTTSGVSNENAIFADVPNGETPHGNSKLQQELNYDIASYVQDIDLSGGVYVNSILVNPKSTFMQARWLKSFHGKSFDYGFTTTDDFSQYIATCSVGYGRRSNKYSHSDCEQQETYQNWQIFDIQYPFIAGASTTETNATPGRTYIWTSETSAYGNQITFDQPQLASYTVKYTKRGKWIKVSGMSGGGYYEDVECTEKDNWLDSYYTYNNMQITDTASQKPFQYLLYSVDENGNKDYSFFKENKIRCIYITKGYWNFSSNEKYEQTKFSYYRWTRTGNNPTFKSYCGYVLNIIYDSKPSNLIIQIPINCLNTAVQFKIVTQDEYKKTLQIGYVGESKVNYEFAEQCYINYNGGGIFDSLSDRSEIATGINVSKKSKAKDACLWYCTYGETEYSASEMIKLVNRTINSRGSIMSEQIPDVMCLSADVDVSGSIRKIYNDDLFTKSVNEARYVWFDLKTADMFRNDITYVYSTSLKEINTSEEVSKEVADIQTDGCSPQSQIGTPRLFGTENGMYRLNEDGTITLCDTFQSGYVTKIERVVLENQGSSKNSDIAENSKYDRDYAYIATTKEGYIYYSIDDGVSWKKMSTFSNVTDTTTDIGTQSSPNKSVVSTSTQIYYGNFIKAYDWYLTKDNQITITEE